MSFDTKAVSSNWSFPTAVRFGNGRISELHAIARELGSSRPLVVTDTGLKDLYPVQRALEALRAGGFEAALFHSVKPNPTGTNVADGVDVLRSGGHDLVVAVGGGSALDAAKAIALMASQTIPMWDLEDIGDNWKRADTSRLVPVIAVPTTAGTGSELGRSSVITHEAEKRKVIVFHPRMMPNVVVMDPELTTGLPAHITAATGMDALSHALEAYCAPSFHPMAEGVALNAVRLIKQWLPVATLEGSNLEARGQMLVASGMGCVALQKGLGAMHALAHPLGALHDAHHGLLNAVLMPYVLEFNAPAITDKLNFLGRFLDLPSPTAAGVIDWIFELRETLDMPHTLSQMGVQNIDFEKVASMGAVDPCAGGNPVPLDQAALRAILMAAKG
ncbi:MAG: iron-containing alcohol dehydrogenase [Hoeflea sp.]|uniref:iron-containing alcohol dehydrogenase n=1 Tax=Hoeflea sp. TaxID=1940281 RepID=UPI001E056010|nr:iron-containing alcohol dehydrogenase [Hoeflea sp.]MBU4528095.1 iron-containing alcohol dehydrogenase [Alphaproteobacteria bacterium]MBU4543691.1 iron-containing alcohol dehydrogenase [Alphaproteobacteria bacterium]MBU4548558.1 iron-containing alcohol dehydrogenase [Alphaproteobacteria bacterium]MBV1725724.1 iron-containing alcohol dehydrogenase [Hoeflea sp.]MBV1762080.1 iron-containing alcohol dehydrogenase [Hoeflea sp.]